MGGQTDRQTDRQTSFEYPTQDTLGKPRDGHKADGLKTGAYTHTAAIERWMAL